MTKVLCADVACKYHGDNDVCTARKIKLSWNSVMTTWEGRQEFHRCKTFEESETYKKLKAEMPTLFKHTKNGDEHAD